MDVSVIIVNYNTLQTTLNCINSIFEKTHGIDFEVILVDNASSDGSKECFSKDKRFRYIYNKENVGFGRANNLGYKYATGRYIFLLNSDTLLLNNAIKYFYDWFEINNSGNIACIGSILLDNKNNPMHSYGRFPSIRSLTNLIIKHYFPSKKMESDYIDQNGYKIVDYVTGADLFIRREIIEKCGFFDPNFFMYYEETDLQFRFYEKGYKSVIIYTPKIMHLHGIVKVNKNLKRIYIPLRSCIYYYKKHSSLLDYVIARSILLFLIPKIFIYKSSMSEKCRILKLLFRGVMY